MELANAVLTYYFTHAGMLSLHKRFHLANRIALWNGEERAKALLAECQEWFVPAPVTNDTLLRSFEQANQNATSDAPHIVAYSLRKPYFAIFPDLIGLEAELFRLRHLHELYGIDARKAFLQRHPIPQLRQLEASILADPSAVRTLSTWAVNFIYLLHRVVLREDSGIDIQALYELGTGYDTANDEQLRLMIYLYTHCIIAESKFYARDLPKETLPAYRQMLDRLETLIKPRLAQTSLDTKLEFLVCCRLANYKTELEAPIHDECARSVSPEGTFLIDTHNAFAKNSQKKGFEASEHRNVLFAMSALPRHLDR